MKVVVLMGGRSYERDISLKTGKAVSEALRKLGHDVYELDLSADLPCRLLEMKPDKVFIALHGPYGEDGRVQGMLDIMGIPYTGSGVLASAIAMDKDITKRLLLSENIPTPRWVCVRKGELNFSWEEFPAVVKPADQGSSIGLKVARSSEELEKAVKELFSMTDKVLIESFVEGRDMTVGILKDRVLPPIEIVPRKGIYDYESKYTKGASEYVFLEDEELSKKLQGLALKVHNLLGLKDMSRVDFRVTPEGEAFVLEVNTVPGMTELSLLPMACRKIGIGFEEMLSIIIS